MEVKWLEDFLALSGTLNFSRAAAERNVTQSAFSRRIRQLESWLGTTLLDRASFPPRLTDAGARFVPVAQDVLRRVYQVRREFQAESGSVAQTVTITALQTLSLTFLPDWLHRLQAITPLTSRLLPDSGSTEENAQQLVDGTCDFFLSYAHPAVTVLLDRERFGFKVLGRERILPVSAPDAEGAPRHRLGGGPASYISYQKASFFGQVLGDLFETRSPQLQVVHEGSMSASLLEMARAGWGLAWVPESLLGRDLAEGRLVAAADASWELSTEIRLYRLLENRRPVITRIWDGLP